MYDKLSFNFNKIDSDARIRQRKTFEFRNEVFWIQFSDPPEPLSSHQPVQTVASGRNTTVSCDVIANPTPTSYTWSKNGHYLPTQASVSGFQIF